MMCLNIGFQCPGITQPRAYSLDDIHIRQGDCCIVFTGHPILRTGMAESEARGWQLSNYIFLMRHSPKAALVCDVCSQCCISNAWLTVCILVCW